MCADGAAQREETFAGRNAEDDTPRHLDDFKFPREDAERAEVASEVYVPTLIVLSGRISIRMYGQTEHPPPHVHAYTADFSASYCFDGLVLDGELPSRDHKIVVKWVRGNADTHHRAWGYSMKGMNPLELEDVKKLKE